MWEKKVTIPANEKDDTNLRTLNFIIKRMYLEHIFNIVCVPRDTSHGIYLFSKYFLCTCGASALWKHLEAVGNQSLPSQSS